MMEKFVPVEKNVILCKNYILIGRRTLSRASLAFSFQKARKFTLPFLLEVCYTETATQSNTSLIGRGKHWQTVFLSFTRPYISGYEIVSQQWRVRFCRCVSSLGRTFFIFLSRRFGGNSDMAKSNKLNGKNVAGAVGIAAVAVEALTPVIEKVIDKLTDKPTDSSQEKSDEPSSVVVPTLYGKGILLRLEEAIEILNNYGLKAKPSESPLPKGNTAYKDYVNSQVIDSFPKSKELTPPGSTVVLYYVTQAVIDESQRLFDEAAKHKVEAKRKKAEEHIRQKERTRQMIIDATDKAKAQFSKVLPGESKKSLNKKSKQ